jgi:hypothetical protein
MSDNVVSIIDGAHVTPPGTPRPNLIEDLERLLEMARSGELDCIAYAVVLRTDSTDWNVVGRVTRSLAGALHCALFRLSKLDVDGE